MNVALIYDWVHTFGGAERILLALHKLFPQAPLYTSIYDTDNAYWARQFNVKSSFLKKVPFSVKHHEWYPLLTPIAFEQFDFSNFDLIISIASADSKGIITKPNSLHICYMLTPTRYLWSHYNTYLSNAFIRNFARPFTYYLRRWDMVAKTRPDKIIAISKTVQKRIQTYYKQDSVVIYPPVKKPQFRKNIGSIKTSDYYLLISRIVPYKRIDLVIKACNLLKRKLIIVGQGRAFNNLKSIAGLFVTFRNQVSEGELADLYTHCKALIVACEEDFGLTAVEAQMFGKPVIAFAKGGVTETVIDGKTGIFFEKQTVSDLENAIKRFETLTFSKTICINNVSKFSERRFKKEFLSMVNFHYNRFFRII